MDRTEYPSDSLIRKVHLKKCYAEVLDSIQNKIRYRKVWVSIHETTDVCVRSVAHFIISILSKDKDECKSFLINTEHLQVANSTNIASIFEDTVNMLTPHVIDKNDILLIITNAAPYMIKSVKSLNVLYTKMMHLTCLAHLLNRVCEEIRSLFPNVDLLIYNAKKVFSKSTQKCNLQAIRTECSNTTETSYNQMENMVDSS